MHSRSPAVSLRELSAMNQAMEGLEGLPDSQKQDLMQKIEEMQVRDRYEGDEITFPIWSSALLLTHTRLSMSSQRVLYVVTNRMVCSLRMYNSLVQKCFTDCVESFRRKDLDSAEEKARAPPLLFAPS